MFSSFKKKTPPPGEIVIKQVAFIGTSDSDAVELVRAFQDYGVKCECFSSDEWQDLVDSRNDYAVILIDFRLGGGMMSISINETLLRNAYKGRMFLLAHDSMEMYSQDYSTVLMMDMVKDNPMKVFNGKEITNADVVSNTVFMKKAIANGRSR